MKIDKIIFVQTFPTGQYQNQKLGMEITLDDSDNSLLAYQRANELVNEAFKKMNPHIGEPITYSQGSSYNEPPMYNGSSLSPSLTQPPVIDRKAIERLEILIDDAKSPEELEIYKDDAEKHGLYGHYLMRAQNFKQ